MKEDEFQEEVKNIIFEEFEVDNWYDIPRPIPYIESNYEFYNGDGNHCPNGLPWSWEERVIDAADTWYTERGCLIENPHLNAGYGIWGDLEI